MQTSYAAGSSSFSKNLLRLAVPIVLQNLVTTAVSSADVIMLGFVSQDALAAGSLASQIMFILNLVYSGISSGVIMLAAQYWGKQDTLTIERIMGIGMRISILISTVFFILACFFPSLLMLISKGRRCHGIARQMGFHARFSTTTNASATPKPFQKSFLFIVSPLFQSCFILCFPKGNYPIRKGKYSPKHFPSFFIVILFFRLLIPADAYESMIRCR